MFFWLWISLTFSSLFYPRHSLLSPSGDLEPILFWNGPDSSPLCNVHFEFISSQTLDCGKQFFFFKFTRIRFLYINVTKILVFHNFFLFQLHFAILFILTDGNFDMKEANYPVNKLFNQTALLIPLILVLSIHAKNLNILADGRNGHLISKRTRNDWLRMKLIFVTFAWVRMSQTSHFGTLCNIH